MRREKKKRGRKEEKPYIDQFGGGKVRLREGIEEESVQMSLIYASVK